MSFLLSINGTWVSLERVFSMGESIIQAVVHKTLTDTHHRVAAHFEGLCYLLVRPLGARSVAINLQ